jgi:hypothetical protein
MDTNYQILYDIRKTGCRYASPEDMLVEARLLGVECSIMALGRELRRRGLDDYSPGRAAKGGNA